MKNPTVYTAGPMRGYKDFNIPAFQEAQQALTVLGFNVLLPYDMDNPSDGDVQFLLNEDVKLITQADALVVLPKWYESYGATFEVFIANVLGKPILDYKTLLPIAQDDLPQHVFYRHLAKPDTMVASFKEWQDYGAELGGL